MRPTRFGLKGFLFYLALAGVFFASPYSNLFFLLLSFLTLQGLWCAVWTPENLRGVTGELEPLEPVPAGAPGVLRARLLAPRRARFQVAVELEVGAARARGQADLLEGEQVVALALPALARGIHALGRARITSVYPFGLLRASRPLAVPRELVVYPAPCEAREAHGGAGARALLGDALCGAGDLQPAGLRDHRDGDEPRSIHWRASARRGALVVKEWEGGAGQGLELQLDRRCAIEELEDALARISAVALFARENKEVLAVATQDLQASFGSGQRPWSELLRFLAGAECLPPEGPAPPPVSPSVPRLPHRRAREDKAHAR